jgi:L-alanine-DL-glutamate epimerase-like enolase superfamily enzyme
MPSRDLSAIIERFAIAGHFTIARGSRTEAVVVTAHIRQGAVHGRGEGVPYARYGESVDGVAHAIESMLDAIDNGMTRLELLTAMKPGAARNALDCALWDLEAKLAGKRVWQLAGLPEPKPLDTLYTLSLDTPAAMAEAALLAKRSLLKIKLGAEGDEERLSAIRKAVPGAVLVVDANEGWRENVLETNLALCAKHRVALVEQPLPAGSDEALRHVSHAVPLCADESLHTSDDLESLIGKYDMVNIKLDKTGGLTEALRLSEAAHKLGLKRMVGCMVSSSLAMAPAFLVAQNATIVDLDGPLLLREDRENGLRYEGSRVNPPAPSLWG